MILAACFPTVALAAIAAVFEQFLEKAFVLRANFLAAGKAAGVLAVDEALAKAYVEKGASFVGVGVDAALLSNATRQLASRFIDSDNDQPLAGY